LGNEFLRYFLVERKAGGNHPAIPAAAPQTFGYRRLLV